MSRVTDGLQCLISGIRATVSKPVRLSARRSDPPMDSTNHGVLQNEISVTDIVGINPNHFGRLYLVNSDDLRRSSLPCLQ